MATLLLLHYTFGELPEHPSFHMMNLELTYLFMLGDKTTLVAFPLSTSFIDEPSVGLVLTLFTLEPSPSLYVHQVMK